MGRFPCQRCYILPSLRLLLALAFKPRSSEGNVTARLPLEVRPCLSASRSSRRLHCHPDSPSYPCKVCQRSTSSMSLITLASYLLHFACPCQLLRQTIDRCLRRAAVRTIETLTLDLTPVQTLSTLSLVLTPKPYVLDRSPL